MIEQSWYERFFGQQYLRARQPTLKEADINQEMHFLIDQLHLQSGMRLLDLCCGHGRHAIPLAKHGLQVTGVDFSEYLLSLAQQAADNTGVSVEFVHGDMREIDWSNHFDAVINMFTAFGFFADDSENYAVLERVSQSLKSGGYFCIDVISYIWLMRNWVSSAWSRGGDDVISLEDRTMRWETGVHVSGRTIIEPEGKHWNMTQTLRIFPPHELVQWLARAGLTVVGIFGNFGAAPFDLNSRRLILIARKESKPRVEPAV